MRFAARLCLCFALLKGGTGVFGLSLLPLHTNVYIAASTNHESTRSVAFDGTNFLTVYWGDYIYPAANPTNQIAARLFSPSGSLLGAPIELLANATRPLCAFGGSNYLAVWVDDTGSILGQRIVASGQLSGSSFVIGSNASPAEIGISFNGNSFLLVWRETNASGQIAARFVSAAGVPQELISLAGVGGELAFPGASSANTNTLVSYMRKRAGTNLWDVFAQFLQGTNISAPVLISTQPATNAEPIGIGTDGTNYLVAWSRGVGPFLGRFTTNAEFPMIFGRMVGSDGSFTTEEFQITRARVGQFDPAIAYDGSNYIVAWSDQRFDDYETGLFATHLQFVRPDGTLAGYELPIGQSEPVYGSILKSSRGLGLAFGAGKLVLAQSVIADSQPQTDAGVTLLSQRRSITPPRLVHRRYSENFIYFTLEGDTNIGYGVFGWTNLAHEPLVFDVNLPYRRDIFGFRGVQVGSEVMMDRVGPQMFFHAYEGTLACLQAQQKMYWAKQQWALEHGRISFDTPGDNDLFRVRVYEKPLCPYFGAYVLGTVKSKPACTIAGHNDW